MNPALRAWLRRPELGAFPKLVLSALWGYADFGAEPGACVWPSAARVAEDLGCDTRRVERALAELRDAGAIARDDARGRRVWRLLGASSTDEAPRRPHRETPAPAPVNPGARTGEPRRIDRGTPAPAPVNTGARAGVDGFNTTPAPAPVHPGAGAGPTPAPAPVDLNKTYQRPAKRADARAPVRPDLEPPRVPADPDAEQHPWRELLAEIRMLTPPGVDPIAVGRTPPPGLLDRLAEHGLRGVAERCEAFAELCRQRPEEARWWARGMFDDKRWEAIGRRLHEARTGSGAKPWAPSSSFETESNPIKAEPVIDLEAKRREDERYAELARVFERPRTHDDQEDLWNT